MGDTASPYVCIGDAHKGEEQYYDMHLWGILLPLMYVLETHIRGEEKYGGHLYK